MHVLRSATLMAEMTIRLQIDPSTGKKNIIIGYHSDSDALPQEHEQHHKKLVEKLVGKGLIGEGEIGQIIVEREETKPQASPEVEKPQQQAQPIATKG